MATNIASRLETNPADLQSLIERIRQGEIKVPKFQRKFVWKAKQALELLDSIVNNYPVGSLLLWRTRTKLAAERNIGDFALPETDDLTPTDYVLDGQQRLTVIYSCLGAPIGAPGFKAGYDLDKQEFIELPDVHQMHVFPVRLMYNTTELLDFRTALKSHPQGSDLQARLDAVIRIITNYKIPVVTLKDLQIDEVCPIFERINSSGTRLSTYDLMVAATWSETFDLNDEAEEIALSLTPKGFGDVDGDTVLKCLSALQYRSVKKEDILKLRELSVTQIDDLVERTKASLLKTVDLLSTEFGVYSWDFLPYEAIAVILSSIFAQVKSLSPDQIRRVRQWFWRAAIGERYRGASESYISKDLQTVQDFVVSAKGDPDLFGSVPASSELIGVSFRSNNSRSRAFILALAALRPRNITNGTTIDVTVALSSYNQKQFHHVYPRAHLRRIGSKLDDNSLMNICILAASENLAVSDKDPNVYLPELAQGLADAADAVFRSNLIAPPSEVDYTTLTYDAFLVDRSTRAAAHLARLCNGDAI